MIYISSSPVSIYQDAHSKSKLFGAEMMKVKISALSRREYSTNVKVLQAWFISLVFILLSSATAASESI